MDIHLLSLIVPFNRSFSEQADNSLGQGPCEVAAYGLAACDGGSEYLTGIKIFVF